MMADRIKGITVHIGGETTGLQKALEGVNKHSRELQKELRDVERLLKFDPENVEAMAQKQKLLAAQVENTSKKLEQLKEASEEVEQQFKEGKISPEQYRAFRREIEFTTRQLANMEESLGEVDAKVKQSSTRIGRFKTAMKEAGEQAKESADKVRGFGDATKEAGEGAMGITAAGGAIGAGAIAAASNFEDAHVMMVNSLGITESKAMQLGDIAQKVWQQGFGADLLTATDTVSQLYASLGDVPDAEMERLTKGVETFNKTFGTDSTESITAMNTVMRNFGVDGSTALDMIFRGAQQTSGVFRADMADALTELAPTLKGMGATGDEAFKLMITASESGMENFDALSSLTQTFADTMLAGGEEVDKAFASMGDNGKKMWADFQAGNISAYDLMIGTTGELSKMEDVQKRNSIGAGLFGDVWTEASADAILGLSKTDQAIFDHQGKAAAAGEMVEQSFSQRLQGALNELAKAFEPLGGVLMDLAEQWMPKITEAAEKLATWFQNLSDPMQNFIVIGGAIAAILPPIIIVIGMLVAAFSNIWWALMLLKPAFIAVGGFIAGISAPVWIAIAAIAALIAIGVAIWKNWDWLSAKAKEIGGIIAEAFRKWVEGVKERMNKSKEDIKKIWNTVMEFFRGIDLKQIGKDIITGLINGIGSMAEKVWGKAKEIASGIGKSIRKALDIKSPSKVTWRLGEETGEGLMGGLMNTIREIQAAGTRLGETVATSIGNQLDASHYALVNYFEAIRQDGDWLNDWLTHLPSHMQNVVKEMGRTIAPNLERAETSAAMAAVNKVLNLNIHSPKAVDIKEASREFNKQLNKMSLMW